jgi:hypothetical protein
MSTQNHEVVERYASKILGIRNYRSHQQEFHARDLIDLAVLADLLQEVQSGESDITPAGLAFLSQYYGADFLSRSLVTAGYKFYYVSACSHEVQVNAWRDWLQTVVPMELSRFIETARGTISLGSELRDDLMPPNS